MPDYHAWTHRPKEQGGTDPIPGLSGPSWAALYDNFVNGEFLTTAGGTLRLRWPYCAISSNGGDVFSYETVVDSPPDFGMDHQILSLHQSGIYTFSFSCLHDSNRDGYQLEWSLGGDSHDAFQFPGQMAGGGGGYGLNAYTQHTPGSLSGFGDWDSFVSISYTVPVVIEDPPQPIHIDALVMNVHTPTGAQFAISTKRLWVTRLGDINSDSPDWP